MSVTNQSAEDTGFPKFLMSVDGTRSFMTMQEAGSNLSSLWARVDVGCFVLEADFSLRDITPAERNEMSVIADQCDADK